MKSFDVYALGNALVDIEYHLDPQQLSTLQIEKGVMTLIDEQRHNQLVNHLGEQHEKMACGGSAANTLIAVAQMGGRCFYSCQVANDSTGQFFIQDLKQSGVDTNTHLNMNDVGVSGKCLVFVTPDADRTMNTFLGASADLDSSHVSEQAISDSEYVYLEGYLVTGDSSREAVLLAREYARKHDTKIALTLSDPTMMRFFREGMLQMIGDGVDLLFANEEEACELSGSEDIGETVEAMKQYAKTFAITRGGKGALVFDGEDLVEIEPHQVEAVDTLGAGDMFAGAFLYGLTHSLDYVDSGRLASLLSANIVTRFGPRLDPHQTVDLLRQFRTGNL